jgi:hypothetical protein
LGKRERMRGLWTGHITFLRAMTLRPDRWSSRAVVRPAMPAPMTHTFAERSPPSGFLSAIRAVVVQNERLSPECRFNVLSSGDLALNLSSAASRWRRRASYPRLLLLATASWQGRIECV